MSFEFKSLRRSRYGRTRYRLVDINCLAYLTLIGCLLIVFHKTIVDWPLYVLIHLGIVVAILEILQLSERYRRNKILSVLRCFYPAAVVSFAWSELDVTVRMLFGTYWATDLIVELDAVVFGVHPTVWVQQFYQPWLDELMNVFYSGYYLFMPLVTITLFMRGKREETIDAFSFVTFAYLSNFLCFYLLPTLGPQMTDSLKGTGENHYTGYLFAEITRRVQASGAVRGGAFPSSHVSGALTWALVARRYRLRMGYVLMPMVAGVAISTVYLGYHHALDPILGLAWGATCYPIAVNLIRTRGEKVSADSEAISKGIDIGS